MKNNLESYFPVDKIIGDYLGVIFCKDKIDFPLSEKSAFKGRKKSVAIARRKPKRLYY
jgi:hypothetical protein